MPVNKARGFTLYGGDDEKLRSSYGGAATRSPALVNQCPHMGLPLETFPDRFLSADGTALICSAHGARFPMTARVSAARAKACLQAITLKLRDGHIYLSPETE